MTATLACVPRPLWLYAPFRCIVPDMIPRPASDKELFEPIAATSAPHPVITERQVEAAPLVFDAARPSSHRLSAMVIRGVAWVLLVPVMLVAGALFSAISLLADLADASIHASPRRPDGWNQLERRISK